MMSDFVLSVLLCSCGFVPFNMGIFHSLTQRGRVGSPKKPSAVPRPPLLLNGRCGAARTESADADSKSSTKSSCLLYTKTPFQVVFRLSLTSMRFAIAFSQVTQPGRLYDSLPSPTDARSIPSQPHRLCWFQGRFVVFRLVEGVECG